MWRAKLLWFGNLVIKPETRSGYLLRDSSFSECSSLEVKGVIFRRVVFNEAMPLSELIFLDICYLIYTQFD